MIRLPLAGALALAIAAPAPAEVVESSADHFVTRDSATVKTSPNETWLALIAPGDWWDDTHTWSGKAANLSIVPQGGGCFCERIPAKDGAKEVGLAGSVQHMTVILAQPMTALRMRGGLGPLQSEPVDGVLTIAFQPDKASGGTKLTMEYVVAGHMRFDVPKMAKTVDQVMSLQLGRLADKLGRVDGAVAPAKPVVPAAKPAAPAAKPAAPAAKPDTKPADPDDVGAALDKMADKDD